MPELIQSSGSYSSSHWFISSLSHQHETYSVKKTCKIKTHFFSSPSASNTSSLLRIYKSAALNSLSLHTIIYTPFIATTASLRPQRKCRDVFSFCVCSESVARREGGIKKHFSAICLWWGRVDGSLSVGSRLRFSVFACRKSSDRKRLLRKLLWVGVHSDSAQKRTERERELRRNQSGDKNWIFPPGFVV